MEPLICLGRDDPSDQMTLDDAIRLLQEDCDYPGSVDTQELYKAKQLAIEALRDKKAERVVLWGFSRQLLPGETEE